MNGGRGNTNAPAVTTREVPMDYFSLVLMFISIAVFGIAARLHMCTLKHASLHLYVRKYMLLAARVAMVIAAAYAIGQARWLIAELNAKIPAFDDALWNCIEAALLLYMGATCIVCCRFIRTQ